MAIDSNYQLKPGESATDYTSRVAAYNTSLGKTGAAKAQAGIAALTPDSLAPQTAINVPPPPAYTDPTPHIAAGGATIAANTAAITPADPAAAGEDIFSKFLSSTPKPVDTASLYNKDYANSGIDAAQGDLNAKNKAVADAQAALNATTASIAGITARTQAMNLQQEGRQAPMFAISGAQAENNRKAAIAALPLQAQALAQQAQVAAAQGNAQLSQSILQQAKDHLDTVFRIHAQDAQAQFQYRSKLADAIYQFADKQQQAKIEALKTKAAQDFQLTLQKNQFDHEDAKAKLLGGASDLQFVAATANQPAGTFNKATGEFKPLNGSASGGSELQLAKTQGNIALIDGLTKNSNLTSAVGQNSVVRNPLGLSTASDFFTGSRSKVLADIQQLTSQLSLDSLIQAKAQGATFGALSEGELKVLSDSATKLGTWAIKDGKGNVVGYKANPTDFKAELDKIGRYAKLDYLNKGGSPADIGAVQTDDGHVWVKNSDGTLTAIK